VTERSIERASFTIERRYEAPPTKVFAAWADAAAKARWFVGPDEWESGAYELDFRVGGRELNRGGPPGGPVHVYNAIYWDIVPDERLVYTYEMLLDDRRVSVSLTTVTLRRDGDGTLLVLSEDGAFLDGLDAAAERRHGMGSLLDALGRVV
jgi:uncharacterized protein YndB with AHSA1/START domain